MFPGIVFLRLVFVYKITCEPVLIDFHPISFVSAILGMSIVDKCYVNQIAVCFIILHT